MATELLRGGASRLQLLPEQVPVTENAQQQIEKNETVYGKTLELRELFLQTPLRVVGGPNSAISIYNGRKFAGGVYAGAEMNEQLNLEGLSTQALASLEQHTRTGSSSLFGLFSGSGPETEALVDMASEALTWRVAKEFLHKLTITEEDLRTAFREVDGDYTGARSVLVNHLDTEGSELRCAMVAKHGGHLWFMRLGDFHCVVGHTDEHEKIQYRVLGNFVGGSARTHFIGNEWGKKGGGSATPEVVYHVCSPSDRYVLLLSRGIMKTFPPYELVATAHRMIHQQLMTPGQVARKLVDDALKRQILMGLEFSECMAVVLCINQSGSGQASMDLNNGMISDLNLTPSGAGALAPSRSKKVMFTASNNGAVDESKRASVEEKPPSVQQRDRDSASSYRGLAPGSNSSNNVAQQQPNFAVGNAPGVARTSSGHVVNDKKQQGFLKSLMGMLLPSKGSGRKSGGASSSKKVAPVTKESPRMSQSQGENGASKADQLKSALRQPSRKSIEDGSGGAGTSINPIAGASRRSLGSAGVVRTRSVRIAEPEPGRRGASLEMPTGSFRLKDSSASSMCAIAQGHQPPGRASAGHLPGGASFKRGPSQMMAGGTYSPSESQRFSASVPPLVNQDRTSGGVASASTRNLLLNASSTSGQHSRSSFMAYEGLDAQGRPNATKRVLPTPPGFAKDVQLTTSRSKRNLEANAAPQTFAESYLNTPSASTNGAGRAAGASRRQLQGGGGGKP